MLVRVNLEFRRYEENEYDFVDNATGRRIQGVKKTYVFLTEEDKIIKVSLPKDKVKFELNKGDELEATMNCVMKPYVDKENGKVNEANFSCSFELVDIIPFKSVNLNNKPDKKNSGVDKLGGTF